MSKTATKTNKKEEQKKLIVRIICLVLVVALLVTSLLAMFPTLFQKNTGSYTLTLQDLVDMGLIQLDEEGNIIAVDDSLIVTDTEATEAHDHE